MAAQPAARKANRKKKATLTPAERAQAKITNDHIAAARRMFGLIGFQRVTGVAGKEFVFDNQKSDVDDIFVYENIIVLAEYTASQSSNVGDHLKNKKIVYDKILNNVPTFVSFLKTTFPEAESSFASRYHQSQVIVKIAYCSRYDIEQTHKENIPGPVYLDYSVLRYFLVVAHAIKRSARHEFLHFLGIETSRLGVNGAVTVGERSLDYKGSILPEAHSNFEEGYKVVSFYADANALLRTAYVLRKEGWQDSINLYQRMISSRKIESIRAYLKTQKRVFVNNIIVTLPPDVKPLAEDRTTIDTSTLVSTAPVVIQIPDRANSVGIVDGQHRVFAYHETDPDDPGIAQLRVQQNLLVTGIIYPENTTPLDREKFEARLFLEINSTQTNAKSQLKQAIGIVIEPYSNESIAARVLTGLSRIGPLSGLLEQYFYDVGKLKTSSIVSYGLRPLVKTSGNDSLFAIWTHQDKAGVSRGTNSTALVEYIAFCVSTINNVLGAIRRNLAKDRWTADRKVANRVMSTTYINSFLIVIRMLIERGVAIEQDTLARRFANIGTFNFTAYRSSQYNRMAEKIVETYFGRRVP